MMKIIYVMDPYDGWCYAGSENILRLYMRYRSLMEFEVLPAGMLTGELCCNHHPDNATAALRSLRAIEKETKTPFGEKHKEALRNKEFLMDSEIPSRAIMTVRQLAPEQTLPFVHALLHARFYHGMDLNDTSTYLELCEILDIDKQAFFQIFNYLHQKGKQIILSSDCPPVEMQGLNDRLLSRFKWGLSAELTVPNFETRLEILKQKIQKETNGIYKR